MVNGQQVDLRSIDVDGVFECLRNSTSFFRTVKQSGDDIVTECPFHSGGMEKHPSFGICNNRQNPSYGICHCFACGESHSILQLINFISGREFNDPYAVQFVQSISDIAFLDIRGELKIEPRTPMEVSVTPVELLSYQTQHVDYLDKRNIKPIIQTVFQTGFDMVTNSVTFPVKERNGVVNFVVRRRVDMKWYNYPAGVTKPIYGLYEFSKIFPESRSVILVESVINALTLWGYGLPAVALLGTGSMSQIALLNSLDLRHYVLCFDGDKAGMQATAKFQKKLKASTSVVPMPPGYDVNDLDETSMRILYQLRH